MVNIIKLEWDHYCVAWLVCCLPPATPGVVTIDNMQIRNRIWRLCNLDRHVLQPTPPPPAHHLGWMDIPPIILPSLYPDNLRPGGPCWTLQTSVIDYLIVNCPVKRSTQKHPASEKRIFLADYLENCYNQSNCRSTSYPQCSNQASNTKLDLITLNVVRKCQKLQT